MCYKFYNIKNHEAKRVITKVQFKFVNCNEWIISDILTYWAFYSYATNSSVQYAISKLYISKAIRHTLQ